MQQETVIKAIDDFCAETGLKPSSVGQMAVRNRHTYRNIKRGSASLAVTRAVVAWIEAERQKRSIPTEGTA